MNDIEERISRSITLRMCAECGADLNETGIVGSGSFSDGLFCSLDCYASFHYGREEQKAMDQNSVPSGT